MPSEYPARPESAVHALLPSCCCGFGPLRVRSPRCQHGACHWRPVSGTPMVLQPGPGCMWARAPGACALGLRAHLVTLSGRMLILVPCHSARRCAHRHPRCAVVAHFYSSPCSYNLQQPSSRLQPGRCQWPRWQSGGSLGSLPLQWSPGPIGAAKFTRNFQVESGVEAATASRFIGQCLMRAGVSICMYGGRASSAVCALHSLPGVTGSVPAPVRERTPFPRR